MKHYTVHKRYFNVHQRGDYSARKITVFATDRADARRKWKEHFFFPITWAGDIVIEESDFQDVCQLKRKAI